MPQAWNAVTAVIALSGMFSIAWTTSFLIGMVAMFHNRKNSSSGDFNHRV
jgi:hypothetical protein